MGQWNVYNNNLIWSTKLNLVASWKNGKFSTTKLLFPDKLENLRGTKLRVNIFLPILII